MWDKTDSFTLHGHQLNEHIAFMYDYIFYMAAVCLFISTTAVLLWAHESSTVHVSNVVVYDLEGLYV